MTRYWLNPKSPTAAVSIDLGVSETDARESLVYMGYTEADVARLLDGVALRSEDGEVWSVSREML